ncbi:MAG: hypothetical protein V1875_08160 [Candidatus Altiarchaeota archaeon]
MMLEVVGLMTVVLFIVICVMAVARMISAFAGWLYDVALGLSSILFVILVLTLMFEGTLHLVGVV